MTLLELYLMVSLGAALAEYRECRNEGDNKVMAWTQTILTAVLWPLVLGTIIGHYRVNNLRKRRVAE